jgi:hypothetical protein
MQVLIMFHVPANEELLLIGLGALSKHVAAFAWKLCHGLPVLACVCWNIFNSLPCVSALPLALCILEYA